MTGSFKKGFAENRSGELLHLSVSSISETGLVRHAFSTRFGGVSSGEYESMNLGFGRGDSESNVIENFARICSACGLPPAGLAFTRQVHGNAVRRVTAVEIREAGSPFSEKEADALVTNEPGVVLTAFFADCVPIFLLDPVKKAIGLVHSGWRGTALRISARALDAMAEHFGSAPRDIIGAVGPSIGPCCFETEGEVPDAFLSAFGQAANPYITPRGGGKYHVDLWGLNVLGLALAGVAPENITLCGRCTSCEDRVFFSHRKTGGQRGNMAAFIALI